MSMRVWLVSAVMWAGVAGAQGAGPTVTLYPVDVVRPTNLSKQQLDDVQSLARALLRKSGVVTPDTPTMLQAMTALKRTDCDRDNECLAQLAKRSGSLYGAYVALDQTLEGKLIAWGRVVRDDGKLVGELAKGDVSSPRGTQQFVAAAEQVLEKAYRALALSALPVAKAVEPVVKPTEPVVVAPVEPKPTAPVVVPAVVPVAPKDEGRGLRTVGWVGVGVGAAAAVAGAVVFATSDVKSVQIDSQGYVARDSVNAFVAVRNQQAGGMALMLGGGGLAVIGVLLVALAPAPVHASLMPLPGGAAVSVGGTF